MVSEQSHPDPSDRLAWLAQLGVDVYVSRRPLPQALDSRIVTRAPTERPSAARPAASARAPALPASSNPGASRKGGAADERARLQLELEQTKPPPRVETAKTEAAKAERPERVAAASRAVSFNLLTVAFHTGVMFVSDIRQAPLPPVRAASVTQFLHDVMAALGRAEAPDQVNPAYFCWPLVKKHGVDARASTARDVLAGLINRQLKEANVEWIVLMGRNATAFVEHDRGRLVNGAVRVLHSEPLGRLFVEPSLKAELWRTLQPLSKHASALADESIDQ